MTPVYQITGAKRGENGDCFQACIASLFGYRLSDVPNFMNGTENGKLLPKVNKEFLTTWLRGRNAEYVEFGFNWTMDALLDTLVEQFGDGFHYLLTGCTAQYTTHVVVCRGGNIVHDPATSPGHTVLLKPCRDGFWRVGLLVMTL